MNRLAAAFLVVVTTAGLSLTGCQAPASATTPAPPDPVPLVVSDIPAHVNIGVVFSLTSPLGEGEDWKDAAAGAQLAAWRLRQGGADITLTAVDDSGRADGATAAVDQLATSGVSAIIMATSGSHIEAALDLAAQRGVPVIAPYQPSTDTSVTDGVWYTGPSSQAIGDTMVAALAAAQVAEPLVIEAGSPLPVGLGLAPDITFAPGDDQDALVKAIAKNEESKHPSDGILVSGPAEQQAAVVRAIQSRS